GGPAVPAARYAGLAGPGTAGPAPAVPGGAPPGPADAGVDPLQRAAGGDALAGLRRRLGPFGAAPLRRPCRHLRLGAADVVPGGGAAARDAAAVGTGADALPLPAVDRPHRAVGLPDLLRQPD